MEFIPNPYNKPEVNHKNWIKTDNRIDNLEWCTRSENCQHAYDKWLNKTTDNHHYKSNHPMKWKFWEYHNSSISIEQYSLEWYFIKEFWWMSDAMRNTWIHFSSISKCCLWQQKTAGWFIWKYKNK